MFPFKALAALATLAVVSAQQVGTNQAEVHPKMTSKTCTKSGGCVTQQTSVVLDSNWRWLHSTSGYTNCYTGNTWDATLCPDDKTCAANCALEGADYSGTYGITTSGNALTLKFVTGKNIGSRVYLLDPTDSKYQLFKLLNQEFTFDVDMSNLGCGLNGALYLSQMDADGGLAKYPTNKAGAKYGTGYCDAQCPHDMKFINGEANVEGWTPSTNDVNAGSGKYGTCCTEMDIWEANFNAAAYTPHPCSVNGQTRCSGTDCGDDSAGQRYSGVCDKDGCDFNSYRQGDTSFLGQGKTIDTNKKFTVVTQFITADGTSTGALSEIRRIYVQDGKVYQNSQSTIPGVPGNSISDSFCAAQKSVFGDQNIFKAKGGIGAMSSALKAGMVLSMSVWDDHAANMLWLDSTYPVDKTGYGGPRGPCATTSGVPKDVEANQGSSSVTFSNIRFGDIGSTYTGTATTPGSSSAAPSSSTAKPTSTTSVKPSTSASTTKSSTAGPAPTGTVGQYGQCGGQGWTGATACVSPYTCKALNAYYSQCL